MTGLYPRRGRGWAGDDGRLCVWLNGPLSPPGGPVTKQRVDAEHEPCFPSSTTLSLGSATESRSIRSSTIQKNLPRSLERSSVVSVGLRTTLHQIHCWTRNRQGHHYLVCRLERRGKGTWRSNAVSCLNGRLRLCHPVEVW